MTLSIQPKRHIMRIMRAHAALGLVNDFAQPETLANPAICVTAQSSVAGIEGFASVSAWATTIAREALCKRIWGDGAGFGKGQVVRRQARSRERAGFHVLQRVGNHDRAERGTPLERSLLDEGDLRRKRDRK